MSKSLALLLIGIALASSAVAHERIWLKHAQVNGKSVKLVFDSGSSGNLLSPEAFKRLGLRFIPAETNNTPNSWTGLWPGLTEPCSISLDGTKSKTAFVVLDLPDYEHGQPDFDGGIGWYSLRENVLSIDAISHTVVPLPEVTRQALHWPRFSLSTNSGSLDLLIPFGDGREGILCVDTGASGGVSLPDSQWAKWTHSHDPIATTLTTVLSPGEGFHIQTEAWAPSVSFGPITLTDVPISNESPKRAGHLGTNYIGTLGLAALKRLDIVVDGVNGVAYLQPKKTAPPSYDHNRLGAVFVATDTRTNQGVAYVVTGGPAYEAGVRDGDLILQVDGIAYKSWSWSGSWLSNFHRPAGTKVKLTLQRDGKTFQTTATLRDILHPEGQKR